MYSFIYYDTCVLIKTILKEQGHLYIQLARGMRWCLLNRFSFKVLLLTLLLLTK